MRSVDLTVIIVKSELGRSSVFLKHHSVFVRTKAALYKYVAYAEEYLLHVYGSESRQALQ
jgi:hypothetical protein